MLSLLPSRRYRSDLLVAYRMPATTGAVGDDGDDDVVVVYPSFHDDWGVVKAEVQAAKKRKAEAKSAHAKLMVAMAERKRQYALAGGGAGGCARCTPTFDPFTRVHVRVCV